MVIQRESHRLVIPELAQKRIKEGRCPTCDKPKSEWTRRTDWNCCSNECTTKFMENDYIFGWTGLRAKCFQRDKGICQMCGEVITHNMVYVADHIIPIALGGPQWDINNVQTLCVRCNKIKTKEDAAKIAKQRLIEKKQKINTNLINFKVQILNQ